MESSIIVHTYLYQQDTAMSILKVTGDSKNNTPDLFLFRYCVRSNCMFMLTNLYLYGSMCL